ncbi:MAG: hypothetical protein GF353_04205 [Candidatus Lokiarchaeota archaeon]|nr:hypothetical protein [Candidatus Lokiarchaeota archaeon]
MHNSVIAFLLIIISYTSIYGQNISNSEYYLPTNILKFANYLYENNEYQRAVAEYERYLFSTQGNQDSIHFKIGLCYYLNNQFTKSESKFAQFSQLNPNSRFVADVFFYLAYINYKLKKYKVSTGYISRLQNNHDNSHVIVEKTQLLRIANQLHLRNWTHAEKSLKSISPTSNFLTSKNVLSNYLTEGRQLKSKNKYVAVALSAILPGAGKIYVGKPIDGLFSFVLFSLTTWQSYDGFSENNIKSTKGWIFASIGTAFYLGNIYGSAVAAKIYNQEINHAFDTKISIELSKAFGH